MVGWNKRYVGVKKVGWDKMVGGGGGGSKKVRWGKTVDSGKKVGWSKKVAWCQMVILGGLQ